MRIKLKNVNVCKGGILYRQVTVTEENELELHDVVEEVFIFIIIMIFIIVIIMIFIIVIIMIVIIITIMILIIVIMHLCVVRTQADTCVRWTLAWVAKRERLHTPFRFSVLFSSHIFIIIFDYDHQPHHISS